MAPAAVRTTATRPVGPRRAGTRQALESDRLPRLGLCGLVVVALLIGCGGGEQPLRFAVTFEAADGLEAGDEVHFRDLEIGTVTKVGLDENGLVRADVEVEPEHRSAVAYNSVIEIRRAGILGGRQLLVSEGEGPRAAVRDGAVLTGSQGMTSEALEAIKGASRTALESLQQLGTDLQQRFSELSDSPEAAEMQEALTSYRERLEELGSEGAEKMREEAKKLREKADEMGRALEEKGLEERARELREEVEAILEKGSGG